MTFDLIFGLHMQIQTWHPPLRLCIHAKYYVKSGLTNVLKNANKTKTMHLFSIRIANYTSKDVTVEIIICVQESSLFVCTVRMSIMSYSYYRGSCSDYVSCVYRLARIFDARIFLIQCACCFFLLQF